MNFKTLLFVSVLALPFGTQLAHAEDIDVTEDLVQYLNNRFVGATSASRAEWDNTTCIVRVPLTGDCAQRGGTKIYGEASGQVDQLAAREGNGWTLQVVKNPWTHLETVSHWVDLRLTYTYSGNSQGKKQCFPGNFFCGYEWDTLHPTGRIVASFIASADRIEVRMNYQVVGGNGDKPNKILRDAMVGLKPQMQQTVQDFILMKGSTASVRIIDEN